MERRNGYHWFLSMMKEFVKENKKASYLEIVNIYECPKTSFIKAVIKLSERHVIEKNISDIIIDNNFIDHFDSKTVRALTYLATVEQLKPDYSIVVQKMDGEIDDYILELKTKNNVTIKKLSSEISRDKELLSKLDPIQAHRVGYMTGACETAKEYQLLKSEK